MQDTDKTVKHVTIRGQKIKVTVHGKPDPILVQKAYERLISNILLKYDEEQMKSISTAL